MTENGSPQRPARPWDLFNKKIQKVTEKIAEERLSICKQCPRLINATTQCKECGCFMNLKVKLPNASCPLNKWHAINISEEVKKQDEEMSNG